MTGSTLIDLERRFVIRISVSPAGPAADADRLVMLAAAPTADALAVVYDLSDSAQATARTATRLPGLLRGWDRSMPAWPYALGDTSALADTGASTVGDLIDSADDRQKLFADTARLNRYRHRGSFIAPTLEALARRVAAENVGRLRVIVLSDGQLTDFAPAAKPPAEVICLIEPGEDAGTARSTWHRVMGDAPLHSVAEAAAHDWFSARQQAKAKLFRLRICGEGVRRSPALPPDSAADAWFDWTPSSGVLFLRSVHPAWETFGIDIRVDDQTFTVNASDLATASPVAAGQIAEAATAFADTSVQTVDILFDSADSPAERTAAWQFASEAFDAASRKKPWPEPTFGRLIGRGNRATAMICLCNRVPIGPVTLDDRVVIVALPASSEGLALPAGHELPIGTLANAYAVRHDLYEDRWYVSTSPTSDGPSQRIELHPTASDHLPPLLTTTGVNWLACFSGPAAHSL